MNHAPHGSGQAGGLTDLPLGWGWGSAAYTALGERPHPNPSPEGEGLERYASRDMV